MPRIWQDTIDEHRDAVQTALLDAVGALVAQSGLAGLTMAGIANQAGVGRATLYRYFPDLESILTAWHGRHIDQHLERLVAAQAGTPDPKQRLLVLFDAYVQAARESGRHGGPAAAALHRRPHVVGAEKRLRSILRNALADAAKAGAVRTDVPAEELVEYVLAALGGAAHLSGAASDRLVAVTLAGLEPPLPRAGRR